MKKTIYSIVVSFLFLVSSCTLEQEVYDKINPGMFPQNAEDVNALVNSSAYYVFSPWGIFEVAAGYVTTSEMVTDYVEIPGDGPLYITLTKLTTGTLMEIIAACMIILNIWLL